MWIDHLVNAIHSKMKNAVMTPSCIIIGRTKRHCRPSIKFRNTWTCSSIRHVFYFHQHIWISLHLSWQRDVSMIFSVIKVCTLKHTFLSRRRAHLDTIEKKKTVYVLNANKDFHKFYHSLSLHTCTRGV